MAKKTLIILLVITIISPLYTMHERPLMYPYGGDFGSAPYSSAYIATRALGLLLTAEEIEKFDKLDQKDYGHPRSRFYTEHDDRREHVKEHMRNVHEDFTNKYNAYEERKKNPPTLKLRRTGRKNRKKKSLLNQFKTLTLFEKDLNTFKNDKKN